MTPIRIALTGATGFVGAALLDLALSSGMTVDALTRRRQRARKGVTWIAGALDKPGTLERLVRDADAVIHVAGVVNAPDRAGFEEGNAHGTRNLIDAIRKVGGTRRLVHVSSLAAREPGLSDYGWSKQMAERHVMASGLDWTIVRPPAIYGPEDREMLELFRMAQRGFMLMPPAGKLSVIQVTDLAQLLLSLAGDRLESVAQIYEVDDGHAGGWSHRDFGTAIARAVGRQARIMATPGWALAAAARLDRAFRGARAKLTPDRARYFCHPDWVSDAGKGVPADIWRPAMDTPGGLAATAAAYRAKGWL